MLRLYTATDLQPGDLLRLREGWTPGVGRTAFSYMKVSIVAYVVLRFVGGEYDIDTGLGIRKLTAEKIEAGVADGKWEIEERS